MVAKADTPSVVKAMCKVRDRQGVWQGLSQNASELRWQVLSVQRKETMNPNPQQPLIGMTFTNADPRYAGRLDDKQEVDTIVTMKRVRKASVFNAELADKSTL